MKITILSALLLAALAVSPAVSQEKDKKDKKKKKAEPELTVVEVRETPPVYPEFVPQKPANGSLFTAGAENGNLLADFRARNLGDLIFIDVVENSSALVTSGAQRSRDSGTLGGIVTAAGALPVPGAAVAGTVAGALGTRKYEGDGSTQRNSRLRSRIAARVVEVLPNGDLRIEGVKQVRINKETEQLAVTGIVRKNDIAADNSVPTVAVGDLRVEFNGKGVASADNAPGWLFRFFDKITPF